jgi:hypothetical protein
LTDSVACGRCGREMFGLGVAGEDFEVIVLEGLPGPSGLWVCDWCGLITCLILTDALLHEVEEGVA